MSAPSHRPEHAEAQATNAEPTLEDVRKLRKEGDANAAAALSRAIKDADRKQAFSALLHKRWDDAKDRARHPLTGGLLDGPGT